MKLLVTGGAGFIGSHLIRMLLDSREDAEVLNFDALTYAGNLENLTDVESHARYRFVKGDIADPQAVARAMEGADCVINVAAESHVDRSIESAARFIQTNVVGTEVLLSAARSAGVQRFLQVSTDEVYGQLAWRDPNDDSAHGDAFTPESRLLPRSPYAASKAAADLLALSFHATHGLDVVVTRASNNYGPFQFPEKLIPLAVTNLLDGGTVPVYGDGLHIRDWIHVEDHCRGIVRALESGRSGAIYHFGASEERTNLDLVRMLLDILDMDGSRIRHVADRAGHDRRYAIDSSGSRKDLDWRPQVPFAEGLRTTVEWYARRRDWWERVRSGAYRDYYARMYGKGGRHGTELALGEAEHTTRPNGAIEGGVLDSEG